MFTGIIEEIGSVTRIEQGKDAARFTVYGPLVTEDASHGDSISVSGVCLTVVERSVASFTADVMGQTLATSTFSEAIVGQSVNLERAARIDSRLGGHIVQGHIDSTSSVLTVTEGTAWRVIRFTLDPQFASLVVPKGSIAIDGVSLTVSGICDRDDSETSWFEVSLIPETLVATTLGLRKPGDHVNIETDILARHVERLLTVKKAKASA